MDISNLLMMTSDDIDFESLEVDVLEALIRSNEDQFIATDALHELNVKDSQRSLIISKEILEGSFGDKFLMAQAISIIYLLEPNFLFRGFRERISQYGPVLLDELVDLFWVDLKEKKGDQLFQSNLNILVEQLKHTGLDRFDNQDYINDLLVECDKNKVSRPEVQKTPGGDSEG